MVWTLLAFLCVVATKYLTSVRLRGLKIKLEAIRPEIDDLRLKVADSEEQMEALKLKVEERESLLTNLSNVIDIYEEALFGQSATDHLAEERVQMKQAEAEESAGM
jgi:chromosome segregation ATPase